MSTINKDLGMVTAYAYAVAGGYTGTEAEFEELLGSIADTLEEFENFSVTVTTLPAGSSATASYADGILSLGIPKGDKGDQGDKGETGLTPDFSIGTVETLEPGESATAAITGTDEAPVLNLGIPQGIKGDQGDVNATGTYPDLTAGKATNADQLISSIYTEDQTPYNFRQSGGGLSIGDREIDKIVGGTVAWNQLVDPSRIRETRTITEGATLTNNGDGSVTVTGTLTSNATPQIFQAHIPMVANHVYYWNSGQNVIRTRPSISGAGNWSTSPMLFKANESATRDAYMQLDNGVTYNTVVKPMVIDFTAMFGSAIADYIYSLEQATPGAGVAYFRKLFPKPYYEYNAGDLMSVQAASHEMVGFNQWDTSTDNIGKAILSDGTFGNNDSFNVSDYIRVLPGTTYFFKDVAPSANALTIAEYDADKNFIRTQSVFGASNTNASGTKVMSDNTCFVRVARFKTSAEPVVNISHNGSRNGEYEPYEKHSYELDANLTLRGVPKLDASNNLYYDGDEYESDGSVTRNIVEVDMAELAATTPYTGSTNKTVSLTLTTPFPQNYSDYAFLSEKYLYRGHVNSASAMNDPDSRDVGIYAYHNVQLADRFKIYVVIPVGASVEGKLVYKKATPTIEQATPYTNPQTVSDWGTEEYVDAAVQEGDRDVAVPVGHVTDYLANLRDKLQNLPDAANADGTYLVQQTSGQMALLAYTPGVNIPAAPTTDGTYTLQAVVSGGVATYSWVSS